MARGEAATVVMDLPEKNANVSRVSRESGDDVARVRVSPEMLSGIIL